VVVGYFVMGVDTAKSSWVGVHHRYAEGNKQGGQHVVPAVL
jgi:hypothetical protein